MAALMRCNLLKYRNLGQSLLKVLSASKVHGFATPVNNRSAAFAARDKETLKNEIHDKIDLNIGISNELFQSLYLSCAKHDSLTDNDAALLLHICSIGPFDLPAKKRIETADKVWNRIEELGIQLSTKLYNIKLKAYITNRTPFNPLDELVKMKSLGLNPDKVTYGIILEGFCQNGDIAGANNVLEAMKSASYLIGINVFNSFITGHLKAGSPEEAANVLEVLRSRGLTPNSDTFYRFAAHYAEEGDIQSVMKYISEAEKEGVPLDHAQILDIYRILVTSGHYSKAEPVLKLISDKGIYRGTFMQKSCQLASEGFYEAALQLYAIMPRFDEDKAHHDSGSFLLKAVIINRQSADTVMNLADRIAELNMKALPHRNALLYAYKSGQTDLAVQLLELMKAKNHEIKVPHIVPAICWYRKTQEKQALYRVISMLLELNGEEHVDDKLENLVKFAYPALVDLQESREDIVQNFQGHEKTWNLVFFVHDLTNKTTSAVKNGAGKKLDASLLQCYAFQEYLFKCLPAQWEPCVEILDYLHQHGLKGVTVITMNNFVLDRAADGKDWEAVDKLLSAMQEKNLKLRDTVKKFRFYAGAPKNIQTKIDDLCSSSPLRRRGNHHALPLESLESMTVEELERYEKDNPNQNIARLAVLRKTLETNDLSSIKLKLRELEAVGFKLNLLELIKVTQTLTDLSDVESALQYYDEIKKKVGNNYRINLPLTLGIKQVAARNISGALQMVKDAGESTFPRDDRTERQKLWALKDMLKSASTIDDASKLHSGIFNANSLVRENEQLQVHAAYIMRVLQEDDDSDLILRLTKLHETYKVFPCMERVLVRLIEKQDVELLKKVMDLGITVFGSSNFHVKLALSFIQCGLPSKAVAVLQTPGLKPQERSLVNGCQHFLKMKRIDCLESVVKITKDMPVSRSLMLKYLLEGYVAVNDLAKATEVLEEMTESLVTPPKEVIDLLVRAYMSHNLPLPASLQEHVPQHKEMNNTVQMSSSGSESDSESDSSASEKEGGQGEHDSPKESGEVLKDHKKQNTDKKHSHSSEV